MMVIEACCVSKGLGVGTCRKPPECRLDSLPVDLYDSYRETDYLAPSISNRAMVYHFRSRLKL